MADIGVADPNIEGKTIGDGVANDNIGVKMNAILHSEPDAFLKTPGIVRPDPDAEVKTGDNEVGMKPIGQKRADRFVWRYECS